MKCARINRQKIVIVKGRTAARPYRSSFRFNLKYSIPMIWRRLRQKGIRPLDVGHTGFILTYDRADFKEFILGRRELPIGEKLNRFVVNGEGFLPPGVQLSLF